MPKNLAVFIVSIFVCVMPIQPTLAQNIEVFPQLVHSGTIRSISFNDDDQRVVTASDDSTVRIWNARTGRAIRVLSSPGADFTNAIFIPRSNNIATIGYDLTIRIWNGLTGVDVEAFEDKERPIDIFASSDGQHLALYFESGWTSIWTANLKKQIGNRNSFKPAGFSTDANGGPSVIGAEKEKIVAWRVNGREEIRTIGNHGSQILEIRTSPDGQYVVSRTSALTKMWRISDGALLWSKDIDRSDWVEDSIFFTENAVFLYEGIGNFLLTAYDIESGNKLRTISNMTLSEPPTALALSHAGNILLGADYYNKHFRVDLTADRSDISFGFDVPNPFATGTTRSSSVKLSTDRSQLAIASYDGNAYIWNLLTGERLPAFRGEGGILESATFGNDNETLLTTSNSFQGIGTATLWDIRTQRPLRHFPVNEGPPKVVDAVFAKDDRQIITLQHHNTILWDTVTGKKLVEAGQDIDLGVSAFHAQTGSFATMESSGSFPNRNTMIWLHDSSDLKRTIGDLQGTRSVGIYDRGHDNSGLQFGPDGDVIAGYGADGTRVWDISDADKNMPKLIFQTSNGSWDRVVRFSPSGSELLIGRDDHTIQRFDWISGRHLQTYVGHRGLIESLDYSSDGKTFVSSSNDGTVRIWNIDSGEEVLKLLGFTDGTWIAMTPEGFFNVSDFNAARQLNVVRGFDVLSLDGFHSTLFRPDLVREALFGDPEGKVKAASKKHNLTKAWDSGLPPTVQHVFVEQGETTDQETADVTGAIIVNDGGVGRVEIRVNGSVQYVENLDVSHDHKGTEEISASVFLTTGENQIEIVAYNRANITVSRPVSQNIVSTYRPRKLPTLHVLAIGVNEYADERLNLHYAVQDARSVGSAFSKIAGSSFSNVRLQVLTDSDGTPERIEEAFNELSQVVQPDDVFVFFLAGHGKTIDGRYYFIHQSLMLNGLESVREQGINQDTWQRWFASIPASKSLLLYDTCEAGSMVGDPEAQRLGFQGAVASFARATGRTILTATSDTQIANGGFDGHGVFTYTVLEALGAGDEDSDQEIEVTELVNYVERELPQISHRNFSRRQQPQSSVTGSSFSLGKPEFLLRQDLTIENR